MFEVIDYAGCGRLEKDRYPIENGRVVMEWSYAIETSRMRYRITGNHTTVAEGKHVFRPDTRHVLNP